MPEPAVSVLARLPHPLQETAIPALAPLALWLAAHLMLLEPAESGPVVSGLAEQLPMREPVTLPEPVTLLLPEPAALKALPATAAPES